LKGQKRLHGAETVTIPWKLKEYIPIDPANTPTKWQQMGKASFNGYVQGLFMMIVDMFMLRGIPS